MVGVKVLIVVGCCSLGCWLSERNPRVYRTPSLAGSPDIRQHIGLFRKNDDHII